MFNAHEIKRTIDDYMDIKAVDLRAKFEQSAAAEIEGAKVSTKRPEPIKLLSDEESAEVMSLISRFKQIEAGDITAAENQRPGIRPITPPPEGYR